MHRARITVDRSTLEAARAVLRDGQTLEQFVDGVIRRAVDHLQAKDDFIKRGLAAGERARQSGQYLTSDEVITTLEAIVKSKSK